MEINGLPLHPLAIHAAVVFGPIAGLVALAYVVLPRYRIRLRWPMVLLAVVATVSVVVAYLSGENFLEHRPDLEASGRVQEHAERGGQLLWIAIGFGVVSLAAGWLSSRTGAVRVALDVVLAGAAVLMLVWLFLTGEAGARAVWG
jgi:hypothetical protein